MPAQSREWCSENRSGIFGPSMNALRKAFTDAGQEVPDHIRLRLHTGKVEL
jgi:limonene 1,2-monooxygenase